MLEVEPGSATRATRLSGASRVTSAKRRKRSFLKAFAFAVAVAYVTRNVTRDIRRDITRAEIASNELATLALIRLFRSVRNALAATTLPITSIAPIVLNLRRGGLAKFTAPIEKQKPLIRTFSQPRCYKLGHSVRLITIGV